MIARHHEGGYIFSVINSAMLPDGFNAQDLLAPFHKGDASDGHGLGLSIAQDVATKHGFNLQWSREDGANTKFTLTVVTEQL